WVPTSTSSNAGGCCGALLCSSMINFFLSLQRSCRFSCGGDLSRIRKSRCFKKRVSASMVKRADLRMIRCKLGFNEECQFEVEGRSSNHKLTSTVGNLLI